MEIPTLLQQPYTLPVIGLALFFIMAFLLWIAWSLNGLKREVQNLRRQSHRFQSVATPRIKEAALEQPESKPERPEKQETSPQPEKSSVEIEAVDFLPKKKPAAVEMTAEMEVGDEKKEKPVFKKEITEPISSLENLGSPVTEELELPVNEYKLKRMNFDKVLPKKPPPSSVSSSKTEVMAVQDIENKEQQKNIKDHSVHLVYEGLSDFIEECSGNLNAKQMFVPTDQAYAIGEKIDLEVKLKEGGHLLTAHGAVLGVSIDPTPGVEIRFLHVDESGRELIQKIVSQRER